MPHSNVDIEEQYHAGNTLYLRPTVRSSDNRVVDIRGASAVWVLYNDPAAPFESAAVEKTTADGSIRLTDPQNGELEIEVEAGDTEGLGAPDGAVWYHRCDLTDDRGDRSTIFHGKLPIYP
jgi:hypothetical protein